MKRINSIFFILLSVPVWGAATTAVTCTTSTANTTGYTSSAFTPAASDLIAVFVVATGTVGGGTMTDSQALGFSPVSVGRKASTADSTYLFIANALAANSSMTVTFTTAASGTGAAICPLRISGMTRTGLSAIRQTAAQSNQAAAGTPAPAFSISALTGNPTLGFIGNATNPAAMTPPTNWTEASDVGYATPTTGAESVFRDSGFTGTTVTWGGTSASAFGSIIVELDTSAVSGLYPDASGAPANGISTGTTLTWTHVTASCSNRSMIAIVGPVDNTANRDILPTTGVDYNGTAMTYLGKFQDRGGSELFDYVFELLAPASGSHTLTVTFSANIATSSTIADGASVTFCGVHQTYPHKLFMSNASSQTNGTSLTVASTDASSSDGDWIVGAGFSHQAGIYSDGAQFVVANQPAFNSANAQGFSMSIKPALVSSTMTWTQSSSDVWSAAGITIRPATATPTIPMMEAGARTITAASASSATITSFVAGGCGNGLLVYGLHYTTTSTNSVTGITWNSQSLTKQDAQRVTDGAQVIVNELWYLKNPSSATSSLAATFSTTLTTFAGGAQVWCAVDQSTPFGTVAKTSDTSGGSTYTVTVSSATSAVVLGSFWIWPDSAPYNLPNGGELWNAATGSGGTGVQSGGEAKIGAASVVIGGTIAAGGGGIDYNGMGVGINFGAVSTSRPGIRHK